MRVRAGVVPPIRSVGRIGLLGLVLLLSSCAARATNATSPPPGGVAPDAALDLGRDLDQMFGAPGLDHVQWGVSFYSVRQAKTLYSLNASRYLIPASNQKILIAAAAAERLGWDFRFTTRLLATAPIAADGSIDGDLLVTSNGDPSINTRDPERWRAFDTWAAALKAKGVKWIKGRLIGDDNAFAEPGWGVGWAWDNLQYGYAAPVSALQYNENQVELMIGPGLAVGEKAIVAVTPPDSGLLIQNDVVTAAPGERPSIDLARLPGTPHLRLSGQVAAGATPYSTFASVDDPTRFYLNALRAALARYGITVTLGVMDADSLDAPIEMASCVELVVDHSPPLTEIVDIAMKWSRNIYAETLLLTMAPPGAPATGAGGLRAVAETLDTWGLAPEAYLPRDGSGLSRYDYLSPDVLISLLRRMLSDERHRTAFESSLPVSGVSGTLAARMKGTPAEGRVMAKTGTLSHVRSLSGYLTTLDGDTIVFSMLANNFRVPATEIDAVMDAALNRLLK